MDLLLSSPRRDQCHYSPTLSVGELCLQSGRVVLDDEEAAAQDKVAGGHPQHGGHQDHLPGQSGRKYYKMLDKLVI